MSTIKKVTLLSQEEYISNQNVIPHIKDSWWLRTPGDDVNLVNYIYRNGFISVLGGNVADYSIGVRPAIIITATDVKCGDKFTYKGYTWTIIKIINNNTCYALCDSVILHRSFDKHNNDFESSELNQWLNTQF